MLPTSPRALGTALLGLVLLAATVPAAPVATAAATYPSDTSKPDVIAPLVGYDRLWTPTGVGTLRGTVKDGPTLAHNDEMASWINQHATPAQQFKALQDSEIFETNGGYDQSETAADALGSVLEPIYVTGRHDGSLPLTSALVNSMTGSSGAYVDTTVSKPRFAYPRPYLPGSATAVGDPPQCPGALFNASSLNANRAGKPYADSSGSLTITRVADVTDTTHRYSPNDVALSVGYDGGSLCSGGSFPSGHTASAYLADIALATLLPQLGPELLARASEGGNDRIVLGVHYPLDTIGGRIVGEVGLAARWSDADYRTGVLEPARAELVGYLEQQCGGTLASCIARGTPYTSNPYGGQVVPGGSAQVVTDRASALAVYRERSTYGFAPIGPTTLAPSVPPTAQALLLSSFPTLTDAQRTSVLAQTELASGHPLDLTGDPAGSWERLELADAMSATVRRNTDGSVTVLGVGSGPQVVEPGGSAGSTGSAGSAGSTGSLAHVTVGKVRRRAEVRYVADPAQGTSQLRARLLQRRSGGVRPVSEVTASLAGGDHVLALRLDRRARARLRKHGRLRVRVEVTLTPPSGPPVTTTTGLTFRRPRQGKP